MNRCGPILIVCAAAAQAIAPTHRVGAGEAPAASGSFVLDPALFSLPADDRLVAAAAAQGIEIGGFEIGGEGTAPAAGDALCGLVTLLEPGERRQWLVALRLDDVRSNESGRVRPLTIYTSSGGTVEFGATAAAVEVATLGPVAVAGVAGRMGEPVASASGRAVVNREFLALGFDRACRTTARLKAAREEGRVSPEEHFSCGVQPFPEEAIAIGRDIAARAGLTAEDERAFAATFPALMVYMEIITHTRGLKDILAAVVERPSLWSLLVRFGGLEWSIAYQSAFTARVDAAALGFPAGLETHQLPFVLRLNGRPALECILVVAPPDPPLLTSAGIVGLTARRPGSDDRRLVIRVLTARREMPRFNARSSGR